MTVFFKRRPMAVKDMKTWVLYESAGPIVNEISFAIG